MKKMWIVIGVVAVLVVGVLTYRWVMAPSPEVGNRAKLTRSFSAEAQRTLDTVRVTPTQLREADCFDGHKCWIAVNGVVYDIAGSSKWNSGQHYGVTAGTDATEQFVDSGHAAAKLNDLPVVGTLDQ